MAVPYSVLSALETPAPAKGNWLDKSQSSSDKARAFEREMNKTRKEEQPADMTDHAVAADQSETAPAKSAAASDVDGQAANIQSSASETSNQPDAPDLKTEAEAEPKAAQPPQTDQGKASAGITAEQRLANLAQWQIQEQVADKRDQKGSAHIPMQADNKGNPIQDAVLGQIAAQKSAAQNDQSQVSTQAGADVAEQINKPQTDTPDSLATPTTQEGGETAKQDAALLAKQGEQSATDAATGETTAKAVTDPEATIAKDKPVSATIEADGEAKTEPAKQANSVAQSVNIGDKTLADDGSNQADKEIAASGQQAIPADAEQTAAVDEEPTVTGQASASGKEQADQSAGNRVSDDKATAQPQQVNGADQASAEMAKQDGQAPVENAPQRDPNQVTQTSDTTNAQNGKSQSATSSANANPENLAATTQSKEALAAQRANAPSANGEQAASDENSADAAKPEQKIEADGDKKPIHAQTDRQEQLAKLRAPKGAIFSELMAGVSPNATKGTDLDGMTDLFDTNAEIDLSIPQERSVRLTGFDAFAKTGNLPTSTSLANAQAIAAQITRHMRGGENRFEIRLDPAELGKIDVRLTIGSDGQTRAHLFVERPETMDFLMRDQRMLERTLQQSGLQLEDQGLEFSLMDQGDQNQQWAGQQQQSSDDSGQPQFSNLGNEQADPSQNAADNARAQTYLATDGLNLVI